MRIVGLRFPAAALAFGDAAAGFSTSRADGHRCRAVRRRGCIAVVRPDAELTPTACVQALWRLVDRADASLVVGPEYAHGITAVMKNQLDWPVGQTWVVGLPVAVVNPAYGSTHADAALREVLRTMSLAIVERASLQIPVIGAGLDIEAIDRGERFGDGIDDVFEALSSHASTR